VLWGRAWADAVAAAAAAAANNAAVADAAMAACARRGLRTVMVHSWGREVGSAAGPAESPMNLATAG
jgi:hypothetical protein